MRQRNTGPQRTIPEPLIKAEGTSKYYNENIFSIDRYPVEAENMAHCINDERGISESACVRTVFGDGGDEWHAHASHGAIGNLRYTFKS